MLKDKLLHILDELIPVLLALLITDGMIAMYQAGKTAGYRQAMHDVQAVSKP